MYGRNQRQTRRIAKRQAMQSEWQLQRKQIELEGFEKGCYYNYESESENEAPKKERRKRYTPVAKMKLARLAKYNRARTVGEKYGVKFLNIRLWCWQYKKFGPGFFFPGGRVPDIKKELITPEGSPNASPRRDTEENPGDTNQEATQENTQTNQNTEIEILLDPECPQSIAAQPTASDNNNNNMEEKEEQNSQTHSDPKPKPTQEDAKNQEYIKNNTITITDKSDKIDYAGGNLRLLAAKDGLINGATIVARALGVGSSSVRRWMDALLSEGETAEYFVLEKAKCFPRKCYSSQIKIEADNEFESFDTSREFTRETHGRKGFFNGGKGRRYDTLC